MRYVRCRHCGARRTLAKPADEYVSPPPSRSCSGRKYRVDQWRGKHERAPHAKPCTDWRCLYGFPHRRGSRLCIHNPSLTDQSIAELFAPAG